MSGQAINESHAFLLNDTLKAAAWHLEGSPLLLTSTGTCDLYTLSAHQPGGTPRKLVAKIHREGGNHLALEAAVLTRLQGTGVPLPELIATRSEPPLLIMTWIPGESMFRYFLVAVSAGVGLWLINDLVFDSSLRPLPLITFLALLLIPLWQLADQLLAIHQLVIEPPDTAPDDRPMQFGDAWLRHLTARIDKTAATHLHEVVDWLRHHHGEPAEQVLCHGDYHFGNILLRRLSVSGVIDWAEAVIAPREYDLAWLRVVGEFVGIPPWREQPGAASAGHLAYLVFNGLLRLQILMYRLRHRLDRQRMQYFEVLHLLRTLIMIAETERDGGDWEQAGMKARVTTRMSALTGLVMP